MFMKPMQPCSDEYRPLLHTLHCTLRLFLWLLLFVSAIPLRAQLLEDDEPPDRPFTLMLGARFYQVSDSDITNAAIALHLGSALSEDRDWYIAIAALTGGIEGDRITYLGLGPLYYFGERPDASIFLGADFGFVQISDEFGQLNAPIGTGVGFQAFAGLSYDPLEFLPPLQLAGVLGIYDADEGRTTFGLQISVMF